MGGQDNNDRIADLLKQACPPAAASPEFKTRLRQHLNQQAGAIKTRSPKPLWQQPFIWIPAAAASAAIVAIIIYFVVFHSPPLAVTTSDATAIQTTTATLNGNLDSLGVADKVEVSFEWGLTISYGNETTPELREATGNFSANLTGLVPNTTYHYRVKAVSSQSTVYGPDMQFTTGPAPPVATTSDVTNIGISSATLNGELVSLGTAASVTVSFEWGTAIGSYTHTTADQAMTSAGAFYFDLDSLSPTTTYYYRAKALGDSTVYGAERSFTTLTPPAVTTSAASYVTTILARLNGDLTSLGTASSVTVSFQWGTVSESYPNETTGQAMTATGVFFADLSGLTPGTTYYYRASADGDGNTVYGEEKSFTTLTAPPSVVTNDASNVATTSATLSGDLTSLGTDGNVTVSFEWSTATGLYTQTTADQTRSTTGTFFADLSGLAPRTTYYYRAKADGHGLPVYGEEKRFTTLTVPPLVRTSSATGVHSRSVTLNGDLISVGTAGSVEVSFEWGLTADYGNDTSRASKTVAGSFNATLTDLRPNTTYHFRAKAIGDGTAYGSDMMFTTGNPPPLQNTWCLSADRSRSQRIMYEDNTSMQEGEMTIWRGTPVVWRADRPSEGNTYAAGTWILQLTLSHIGGNHEVVVEIGTWDGYVFDSHGTYAFLAKGSDSTTPYVYGLNVAVDSFTVPSTDYVAARITVASTYYTRIDVHVGGSQSFVQSPSYPEPIAPTVVTDAATNVEPTTATLNGYLDNFGTASSVVLYFEWGTTAAYGNQIEVDTGTLGGNFGAVLPNLIPNTTYHFRAEAIGDGISYGVDMVFTTSSQQTNTG